MLHIEDVCAADLNKTSEVCRTRFRFNFFKLKVIIKHKFTLISAAAGELISNESDAEQQWTCSKPVPDS